MNTDLRFALRGLRRSPGFACAAIVTLALGIAANGTVFTLVNGVLLRDLPFDAPDRIVTLGVRYVGNAQRTEGGLSYLELRDWQAGARTFEGIGGYDERTMNVSDEEHAAERSRIRLAVPGGPATGPGSTTEWMTIVGMVPNVQQRPPDNRGFDPVVYVPLAANPDWGVNILVRGSSPLGLVTSQVQEQLRAVDPDIPVFDVRTVDNLLSFQRWAGRVFGSMFAIFAVIALTLATVGLYAVTAYAVNERTREIGLRIALGAGARHVWWLATRRASIQPGIGLVLGLAGSVTVLRVVPRQVTQIDGDTTGTLAVVTILLVLTAFVACLIPARRALAVNPVQTLKEG